MKRDVTKASAARWTVIEDKTALKQPRHSFSEELIALTFFFFISVISDIKHKAYGSYLYSNKHTNRHISSLLIELNLLHEVRSVIYCFREIEYHVQH